MINRVPATRVALLYYGDRQHKKVQQLVEDIGDEQVLLSAERSDESLCEAVADCDLILIEARNELTPQQWQALGWIRVSSLAPVVILTGDKPSQDAVDTIVTTAGADAVISLQLATDVIVAHCQALIRRWRAHPYATPKFA